MKGDTHTLPPMILKMLKLLLSLLISCGDPLSCTFSVFPKGKSENWQCILLALFLLFWQSLIYIRTDVFDSFSVFTLFSLISLSLRVCLLYIVFPGLTMHVFLQVFQLSLLSQYQIPIIDPRTL